MAVAKAEDRERKADRVVEIAFGREHARRTEVRAQDRTPASPSPSSCRCCRRRRTPAARTARASARRGCPARASGSGTAMQLPGERARRGRAATSAAAAPRSLRDADEIVAVEALALERDEEIARRERARVGRHAREAHVLADEAAVHRAGGRRRVHHALPQAMPSAAVATSRVRERRAHAVALLVVLVALAGDEDDVASAARSPPRRGSPRRGRARRAKLATARGANASTIAAAIAADPRGADCRWSRRSDRLARRRCGPSPARLPGSRSPPHPNTQTSSPPFATAGRNAVERLLQRVGRVRVVDHDERLCTSAHPLHPSRRRRHALDAPRARVELDAAREQRRRARPARSTR